MTSFELTSWRPFLPLAGDRDWGGASLGRATLVRTQTRGAEGVERVWDTLWGQRKRTTDGLDAGNERKQGAERDTYVLTGYKEALELNKLFVSDSHKSELSCETAISRDLLSVHLQGSSAINVSKTYSEQEFGEREMDQRNKKSCGVEVGRLFQLLFLLSFHWADY